MKVLILTTVHNWNDPRIFHKEACTLAKEHEVTLAAVGEGPERVVNGVRVRLLGTWNKRSDRPMLWLRAYREIFRLKPDAIHFHDPELALVLLPYALLSNKKIVCDVHEHPYASIAGRQWIPKLIRKITASFFSSLLKLSSYIYDQVILAEESYKSIFPAKKCVHLIQNYALIPNPDIPLIDRFNGFNPYERLNLIYIGAIAEERGALKMIDMFSKLKQRYPGLKLHLVGNVRPATLLKKLETKADQSGGSILLHGYIDLTKFESLTSQAHIGLVPLQFHPNFQWSFATKIFDYMIYGIPSVASNFPLWKSFFDQYPCGITVDASNPDEFAAAISKLASSPEQLRTYSRNGYKMVREKFNWDKEGEKLIDIYRRLT